MPQDSSLLQRSWSENSRTPLDSYTIVCISINDSSDALAMRWLGPWFPPPHLIANNHLLGIKLHRPSHHNLGPPRDRLFLRDFLNVLWSFTWPWTSPHNLMDALGHSFTNLLRKLTMWHYVNLYSLENYHVSLICSVLNLIASLLFKIWI